MRCAVLVLLVVCGAAAQSSHPEQLFKDAVQAQQRGDDELAARKYQELLQSYPDSLEARANLGATLSRLGRFDEAIAQYRAALARNADNGAIRLNLALAYYKKGSMRDAVEQLAPLYAQDPRESRVATLLADCYGRLGQDEQAIAILKPYETAHPGDLAVKWLLGSALVRSGHQREGLERVVAVAQDGHSAEAWLLAGQTALHLNEFELARDYVDSARRLNPRLPGALTLRGMVLPFLGDNPGAITALRSALESDPRDFDAQLTLGTVLHTERDLEGASRHLKEALLLNPSSTMARYQWARLERTQGQMEAAAADLEKVVHADPNWPQPHVDLAGVYFRLKRQADGERERVIFDRLNDETQRRENATGPVTAPLSR